MSAFENRTSLWKSAQDAIDAARVDLVALADALNAEFAEIRLKVLRGFVEERGFSIDAEVASRTGTTAASVHHFNDADMRKGLRHGHVAVAAICESASVPDLIASAASVLALAETLGEMYGKVSLLLAASAPDLLAMCEEGIFEEPDCVFVFQGSADGWGFQHTLRGSREHPAGVAITFDAKAGHSIAVDDLNQMVEALRSDEDSPLSIDVSDGQITIRAARSGTVQEIADAILEFIRTQAGEAEVGSSLSAGPLIREFLPSRVLARRIRTFTNALQLRLDRATTELADEPTVWGCVSHTVATALVGYPVDGDAASDDAVEAGLNIAKATAGAGLDVLGDIEFRGYVDGERIRALRERGLERKPRRWLGVHPVRQPEGGRRTINVPDVIVRGPGIPEPKLDNLIDDEAS